MKNYYITTTIPYVNADPHIGFALEILQADVLARYHRIQGDKVFHNFGSDEHGQKIYQSALKENKIPKDYVDENAAKFQGLKKDLNLAYDAFIRTTNQAHIKAAQKFWELCESSGDIYKKKYKAKYCVGCELEKTDSELINDRCPLHPNREIETIEEKNYFFRFSKYQKPLLDFYKKNPDFVKPSARFNEIKSFVQGGLKDFSISRLKEKLPWGVPVPNDPDHVMYVWFDALVNYISTLGWPDNQKKFKEFWPGIQIAGKDNLRQQTAIWQAMLLSASLPNTKQVFIHGFITINGQKISKSLGNVIHPRDLSKKYGVDATRYYLLAKIHPQLDSDFTLEKFEATYNADLANGLGNLIARVAKLCENSNLSFPHKDPHPNPIIAKKLDNYRFDKALEIIWNEVRHSDQYINNHKVWKSKNKELQKHLNLLVANICQIATDLEPFLPETSKKILDQFGKGEIKSAKPLFPRLK